MARINMVTRTVKGTKAKALVCRISTKEVFETEYQLPRIPKDEKELNKMVTKAASVDPDIKFLTVTETSVEEKLYGMREEEFLAHATVLPPRGTKADTED